MNYPLLRYLFGMILLAFVTLTARMPGKAKVRFHKGMAGLWFALHGMMVVSGLFYQDWLPESVPLFQLQGNFDVKKLHGMYRLMMEVMVKTAGKALASKSGRTAEEDDMLDMMTNGGERVQAENLHAVLAWYKGEMMR